MKRTGTDHLLRAVSSDQADDLERQAQAVEIPDFTDRPRPAVWRLR